MNIDKWMYPKPKVNWKLEDHLGEIIWIPVYQESRSQPKSAAQLVDLQEYCSKENHDTSFFGSGIKKFFGWGSENKPPHEPHDPRNSVTRNRGNQDQPTPERQAMMLKEVNAVYSSTLGVSERQVANGFDQKEDYTNPLQGIARFHPKNVNGDPYRQSQFGESPFQGNSSYAQQTTLSDSHPDNTPYSNRAGVQQFALSPVEASKGQPRYSIPCLFLRQNMFQTKILLYFHSNAEDIHLSYELCKALMIQLNVCVLAMEYPGYSYFIEKDLETSEECICANALHVFDYLVAELHVSPCRLCLNPSRHLSPRKVNWMHAGHRPRRQTKGWSPRGCKSILEHQSSS